jgi:hypothetical protein
MSAADLSELQRWFLAAIMTPGGVQRGLALAGQRHGLAKRDVLRTPDGAGSRMHVYAQGYAMRLVEAMRADFPVLHRVMGADLFDFFARAYVWRHPSRSTTLYDLSAGFADFLERSQAPAAAGWSAFAAQLARLERARAEATRAPGMETAAAPLSDAFILLSGEDLTVRLTPCTRLLALSFPLHAYWTQVASVQDDQPLPCAPAPATCFVAVGRLRYRVGIHALQPWQYHVLDAAAEGAPAGFCALHAAQACDLPPGRVLADMLLWLPLAADAALLTLAPSAPGIR